MQETAKHYFSYQDIHRTVAGLARQIQSGPHVFDLIVAIGTGGFIPARILKSYLDLPILTVGVALYGEDKKAGAAPRKIQWIDEVERKLGGKRVLLVDEVDDSRKTLAYCVRELLSHGPASLAVAVLHCKNKEKLDSFPQNLTAYWAGEYLPDDWLVYPWDVLDPDATHPDAVAAANAPAMGKAVGKGQAAGLDRSDGPGQPRPDSTMDLMLDFGADGQTLVPVVTQDRTSREVLILSWMNRQAFDETLASSHATYWSRSRKALWKKGDTSGNRLLVRDVRINCEQNSLLLVVDQEGSGACHVSRPDGKAFHGCYYRRLLAGASGRTGLELVDEGPYRL